MFVGREAVISAIKDRHHATCQRHGRVALVGLAGVGKTQTAIEYSYRVRESTPDTWVFWIHASNAARLEQSYQQIAAVAEISGRDDPKMNILQLVYQWLCDANNGRWLMVLDNADDDSIFFSANKSKERGPLVRFLPQAAHGSILITSRNSLTARNLVASDGYVIDVQPMSEEDSLALLRVRVPAPHSGEYEEVEKALVQALEFIPLAITQAGSYIANRSPRVTVSRYLQLFCESESNQTHLLQHEDAKDLRRDPSIRHAVITTWQLSFEQIRHDRPAATDLLALMSMFDRQGIPEDMLRAYGDDDGLYFEESLAPLIIIGPEMAGDPPRTGMVAKKSRAIMAQIFPDGEYESWTECQRLLPHAKEVVKSISDEHEDDRLHAATISFKCGCYLLLRGTYKEAGAMHQWALDARENVLGCEHPDSLASVSNLGLVLDRQGKYKEAEVMHRRALEAREKVIGYRHSSTLSSVNNLGLVLSTQGKYQEAEAMHRRVLEWSEKVLGREHINTLTSLSNLGNVLSRQGKYGEAESMQRWALDIREKVIGYEHPSTLTSINNLGLVLFNQGKYKEAEAMHRRALEAREKVLGREHPDTLTSISNLGSVLSSQGEYEEAEAMYRRALEAREKVIGREHPSSLSSLNSLGLLLSNQRRYAEAEAILRRALEGCEKVLGREHPDTLASISNLSSVLFSWGKDEEQKRLLTGVGDTRESART
ncbi:uncharacterized protein N7500_010258 [Penicillium coprophilum]|uniref:uncharacterized protein n=1 Tax=Penicillium coprophilum TaxID=36646 RepID=UPI0023A5D9F0|nr:uncharacterized protein N7500_010258 [Penicillium coprophilum]KAJ5154819.1 hypothetical protein N7500_010258 [Penicillium coprophilum]